MTIVVWDGKVLATDRAATDGAVQWEVTKAWYHQDPVLGTVVLSGTGPLRTILAMRDWYIAGALAPEFPNLQLSSKWCHFLVATSSRLLRYEQGDIPIDHGTNQCAFGEGRDFAYGAMAMGADAPTAVGVANKFSPHCGHGVNTYEV